MPLYDYKCRDCGEVFERFARISATTHKCDCGGLADRMISRSHNVHGDLEPYWDENMGEKPVFVKSKKHRRRLLEERGLTEMIGKGWR